MTRNDCQAAVFPLGAHGHELKLIPNSTVVCFSPANIGRTGPGTKRAEIQRLS